MELRFTQSDFDTFARLSGDDNPIHVDPEFSARTRFGRTVAHGMLLFGVMDAATARIAADRPLLAQELTFTAPTFTEDTYTLSLQDTGPAVEQTIATADGIVTSRGIATFEGAPPDMRREGETDSEFRGLRRGMRAERSRVFTRDEIGEYAALVGDRRFEAGDTVPPAMLGGLVSWLLGVDLPGPGTNWLKQRYRFERAASPETPITGSVEITRLRADKALVDLRADVSDERGPLVEGSSLVLVRDVTPR
jgi:acyl dehydratase